jgi:hypothetical protein
MKPSVVVVSASFPDKLNTYTIARNRSKTGHEENMSQEKTDALSFSR